MSEHRRRWRALLLLLSCCLGLLLTDCGTTLSGTTSTTLGSTDQVHTGRLAVITTMSILADMAQQVGGNRLVAKNIVPIGAVAETYAPTPQDTREIAQANVIFLNGHGLETWLNPLLTNVALPNVPKVELSKDLPALDVGSNDFRQGNPHFWLNPRYAMQYVEVIRDTLIRVDAPGRPAYQANAAAYLDKLKALDQELEALANQVAPAERKMVTNHDAFPYFAQRYGFTIVGNILANPDTQLSARALAELTRKVKEQHVKAVFSESQFNPSVIEAFAKDAGVTVVANLYTDSLSAGGQATTYIDMMRYNMRTIVKALTDHS